MVVGLGIALALLGWRGSAGHRVTETTRYPQQTGELVDMYFQILGENYLWIVVAVYIIILSIFTWQMGRLQL
jgi:hypothetical protein